MLLSGIIQTTSTVITLMSQPDAINKGARGIDENLPITVQHSVYAAIDPNIHFKGKNLQDKVAIITGASRGIGADIAIHLAKAGARVAIISRTPEALEETNQAILKVEPNAQVLKCAVDVTDYAASEAAVKEVIGKFGRLDILVANAGVTTPVGVSIDDKDPELWWRTFEVNIRGVFNFAKPSIPYLRQTSGYAIVLSSGAAQVRMPGASDYGISKHAVNRLVEYIDLENPSIKSFALHPGRIPTGLAIDAKIDSFASLLDKTDLPAATVLYLVTGNADWLSGRYVNSNWDLSEVERDWKDKIVSTGALVNKLRIP